MVCVELVTLVVPLPAVFFVVFDYVAESLVWGCPELNLRAIC